MSNPMTTAINSARRRLEQRPEPSNPDALADHAMNDLARHAQERTLSAVLGGLPEWQVLYRQDVYFKTALDVLVQAFVEASFHGLREDFDYEEFAVMALPALQPGTVVKKGQRWRDTFGREIEIVDAESDPYSVQWVPGGIAPSPIRRLHLLSAYTLVGEG